MHIMAFEYRRQARPCRNVRGRRTATCTYCLLQVLMEGMGHIRDVIVGPDGLPYVALNQPNGQIYRLRPVH